MTSVVLLKQILFSSFARDEMLVDADMLSRFPMI